MEEQLISIETAEKLHKIGGFQKRWGEVAYKKEDGKLYGDRGDYTDYPAPTQSLLQKWLREKYNIYVEIIVDQTSKPKFCYGITGYKDKVGCFNALHFRTFSDLEYTYEKALEAGLFHALELISP